VIAWRARAVPVVDLSSFLPGVEHGQPRSRTLIVRTAQSTVAVPVDAVTEVVHVPRDMLRVPHAVRAEVATAETELHGQLMAVVDLSALVGRLAGDEGSARADDAVA
jgi:chemotaxis signal transduction protein